VPARFLHAVPTAVAGVGSWPVRATVALNGLRNR
jgi:hypothetical protein